MSKDPGHPPEEDIIRKILGDGKAQAQRLIDNARRSVESEKRKAEREAGKVRKEILAKVERKAEGLRSKEAATGQIESKRILLRAREQAISKVLANIEQELSSVRTNPGDYRKALVSLAAEAVAAIDQREVDLKVHPEDAGIADRTFITEVSRRIKDMTGTKIEIRLELDASLCGGGCTALSRDGRIVFDNTFRRRLERMKTSLRSQIVREVLETHD